MLRRRALSIPELAIIAGTRAALGAGIGLLTADMLHPERRKGIGWTLLAVGAISTIPIAIQLIADQGRRWNRHPTELPDEVVSEMAGV